MDEAVRTPTQGNMPVTKKELPWIEGPGGRMRTTLFYGPWQCNRRWMNSCQKECAGEGHVLKGCMWLADIKLDWQGRVVPPLPVEAGGRLAIYHCCCDYTQLPKEKTALAREEWEGFRNSFRKDWSKKFGEWPTTGGKSWPGHHIHDIAHQGSSMDPNNLIPAPPAIHSVFNVEYPKCYEGGAPWNAFGPDLPYSDP